MGRLIFATRDGDEFQQQSRDMRGATDFLGGGICDSIVGRWNSKFWAKPFGCQREDLQVLLTYFFTVQADDKFLHMPDGRKVNAWDVSLNTLKAVSSDSIKLLAHIHAQCELHCWFSDENREWFAEQLADLREKNIINAEYWEPLQDWLRTPRGDVVLSYSVCDEFPDPNMVEQFQGAECAYEAYDESDWDHARLWDECMAALKTQDLELTPERVSETRFGDGLTMYDIQRAWSDGRHPRHIESLDQVAALLDGGGNRKTKRRV